MNPRTIRRVSIRLAALFGVAALVAAGMGAERPAPALAGGAELTIAVGDIWFCDPSFQGGVCERSIEVGGTVTWDFSGANLPHTTTDCGADCDDPTETPLWDSGVIGGDPEVQTFAYTFTEPGLYYYYCSVHPFAQRGIIAVGGLAGDVNCSGGVNAIDAALVLQLGAGLLEALSCEENADLNDDGSINAVDAALILQRVAGLIQSS